MQQNQTIIPDGEENNFNFRDQLELYLMQWKWFVLSVLLLLAGAYFYLRYAVPQYKAVTTILVKDEKKGGMASELSAFADLGMLSGAKSNVDNEIEILKSRTLIQATVKELGLNVSYLSLGRVKSAEIYKNAPIEILFSTVSKDFYKKSHTYRIESSSDSKFTFYDETGKLGDYSYGQVIQCKEGKCTILKKQRAKLKGADNDFNITIQIHPMESVVESFKGRINVMPLSKTTSIAELSIIDPVSEKAEDFLNTMIRIYNEDAIADKNSISENTSKFIEQRLLLITDELDGVEKEAETFKKANRVTDITSEAGLFLQNASEFEKKEIEIETQLKVVKSMTDFVNKNDTSDLIPANILSTDSNASGLISQYNQLVLERNRLLKNAGPNNAVVQTIDNKIEALKTNVKSSLSQQKTALEINRRDLARQNAIVSGKITQIPTLEREARGLGRQQQIKETLYLYLLQKREETAISLAVTEPNAKVIDAALANKTPVSPKKNIIYLAALLLGLLLPFAIIYVKELLDTKIKSRFDIDGKSAIPFLGDVPTSETHNEIISATSRTGAAEALRIIRTNLEFMLNAVPEGTGKTIFVTSTVPKEGKTFIAVNLAGTIALSGKKVLLVGMDIRNPKLSEYLELPSKGVTNYLSSKEGKIEDYIVKQEGFEELYIFPAGVIPPNPAELLMNKKTDELFEQLKKEYDYIVVDTAPVSLVTDTLIIAKNADTFVYVVRANYLDKRMLHVPERLYKENKLPNMSLLLNDTQTQKGYGYGYGYGVEVEKKPWYKEIFK
ncbi:GumC family protein [Flavobacterium sp.]|uniref:GumC family protein n=1 Tax=Flavobacterium sp. TaxID=239 RepID=UPI002B4B4974|nr:polysaccharide biosynthesis tyrosine autokinase [Flavobacterium sp.]HLF51199.1 polysaccharide biosynthesis tyrosine autokinase [Flavobacterium sp.]